MMRLVSIATKRQKGVICTSPIEVFSTMIKMESSIQHENAQDNQDKLRATKIYLSTQEAWLLFCSLGRHKLCDLEFKKK